ncbi:cyclin-T1-like [Adelges cooleyi]|uniref:cyclin-T1-like n=1 Tax=Adelges cooleyi TaxID=133065 RepID=UPI00217F4475|nr:cyclin-T1-like [Adelges cooleyi]XP_050425944.1 cyclin-T1-like [Adelges cooleyi]XP_050425945.1 cyclin-T1-like [Adelges cooleyi]XP_050425946.1 cyclin-T1-like [Adelges cooleyi]XP_050425947.1 cyclin-T1-like [Adelges cooleyi]XP_050425948.1 cyclin-T1-like [Adelges cooleyi]XP_050425949.1 cyclin-T1-like [Adelges cooleyi]
MHEDRWLFTKEELENTPSRRYGLDLQKEMLYRQMAANLIQDIGQRLQTTQLCINTAIVYMHRFYMFHPFAIFHRNPTAVACLFLSAKNEEQPRKLEHVIKMSLIIIQKQQGQNTNAGIDTKSEYFASHVSDLLYNEELLLKTLGFEIAVDHPHTYIVRCCHMVKASRDLAHTAYFMASNSLHLTTMCVQYRPTLVACFCIHMACKWSMWELQDSTEGKPWYWYVDQNVTAELLEQMTKDYFAVFSSCSPRLKKRLNASNATDSNGMLVGDNDSPLGGPASIIPHPTVEFRPPTRTNNVPTDLRFAGTSFGTAPGVLYPDGRIEKRLAVPHITSGTNPTPSLPVTGTSTALNSSLNKAKLPSTVVANTEAAGQTIPAQDTYPASRPSYSQVTSMYPVHRESYSQAIPTHSTGQSRGQSNATLTYPGNPGSYSRGIPSYVTGQSHVQSEATSVYPANRGSYSQPMYSTSQTHHQSEATLTYSGRRDNYLEVTSSYSDAITNLIIEMTDQNNLGNLAGVNEPPELESQLKAEESSIILPILQDQPHGVNSRGDEPHHDNPCSNEPHHEELRDVEPRDPKLKHQPQMSVTALDTIVISSDESSPVPADTVPVPDRAVADETDAEAKSRKNKKKKKKSREEKLEKKNRKNNRKRKNGDHHENEDSNKTAENVQSVPEPIIITIPIEKIKVMPPVLDLTSRRGIKLKIAKGRIEEDDAYSINSLQLDLGEDDYDTKKKRNSNKTSRKKNRNKRKHSDSDS